jgi:hypothetical protein
MAAGRSGRRSRGTLSSDAPGLCNIMLKGRRKGFAKKCCRKTFAEMKASQILSAALRAISPRMRRSFVDRQYSPSTCMDRSEWKIILD